MARTTFRIDFHQPPQVVDQIARNILIADDYREIDYNREVVWKKGTGLMTAMHYIKLEYQGNTLVVSGWVQIGIGSVGGIRGLPGSEAYCSSKAAVISYLESLRNDVRKYGISVTTICPGFVRTPLVAKNPYKMPFILEPEEFAERAVKAILDKDSYRVIPWQMAWVARLLKILPDSVFDWALSGRGEKPRAKELGL